MYIENEKGRLSKLDLDYRYHLTNVRGGWTHKKIIKDLKIHKGAIRSEIAFHKEICKYDTPEEFAKSVFYHGSNRTPDNLKPSVALKMSLNFGGGSGEQYYGISVSKSKNMASNFTGISNSGSVAPILLKRDAVIKHLPDVADSNELEDIIVDLWTEGVDAVVLGKSFKKNSGEQEVSILNPRCAVVGKADHFQVFNKPKMPSMTEEELLELWLTAGEKYKKGVEKAWDDHNEYVMIPKGKPKDISTRWQNRHQLIYGYHEANVEKYKAQQDLKNKNEVENFLKSVEDKLTDKKTKKKSNKPTP